jgi:hypothetical protein
MFLMLFRTVIFFSLLFSSAVNAESIKIPLSLDGPFAEDLAYPENGYSEPDPDFYNMQRLSVISEPQLFNSYSNFIDGVLDIWKLDGVFRKLSVSNTGEKTEFIYPEEGAPLEINFDNLNYLNGIYVVDEALNTIKYFDKEENAWVDYRSIYNLPEGEITTLFRQENTLHMIVKESELCTVWKFKAALEKQFEFQGCEKKEWFYHEQDEDGGWASGSNVNRVYSFSDSVVLEVHQHRTGLTKSRSLSIQKMVEGSTKRFVHKESGVLEENEFESTEYSAGYRVEDGILYLSTELASGGVRFYDVESDTLKSLPYPKSAQTFKVCNGGLFGLYCTFNMGADTYAVYKVVNREFVLDSIYDLSSHSGSNYEFAFSGPYGRARLVLLVDGNNNEYAIEVMNHNTAVLLSMEGRYGIHPIINTDGRNVLMEYRQGLKLHRYEWDSTEEVTPLIEDDEFPEYRVMTSVSRNKKSSDELLGIGSLNLYLLILFLFILFPARLRK